MPMAELSGVNGQQDMAVTESRNGAKRAYRQAMEILDREWLAVDVPQEDLAPLSYSAAKALPRLDLHRQASHGLSGQTYKRSLRKLSARPPTRNHLKGDRCRNRCQS